MAEKRRGIPDPFLNARFVRALLDEYGDVQATLQAMKNRDRAEIIRMVGTRYYTLPRKKESQRSSQPPEQAVFRAKAAAGVVRNEVVAAVAGAPRVVATAREEARVEVAAARVEAAAVEEVAATPVVPAVVTTVAVADLMATVGDTIRGATSGRARAGRVCQVKAEERWKT